MRLGSQKFGLGGCTRARCARLDKGKGASGEQTPVRRREGESEDTWGEVVSSSNSERKFQSNRSRVAFDL